MPRPDRRHVQRLAGRVPRLRDAASGSPSSAASTRRASSRSARYEVVGYDESIRPALLEAVERLAPRSIALNYSTSDPAADGLTHGLWLELQETFADTPFADRFTSSEAIVNALRGRKSPEEVERIRAAARETEEIFDVVTARFGPGLSELEIAGAHARGGRTARPRLRLGTRPLPGRQRRA